MEGARLSPQNSTNQPMAFYSITLYYSIFASKVALFFCSFLFVLSEKYPKATPIELTFKVFLRKKRVVPNFWGFFIKTHAKWGKKCQKLSKRGVFWGGIFVVFLGDFTGW